MATIQPALSKPRCFCVYFDFNYLTRGLALYASLQQHCRAPFEVWMLCLDRRAYHVLAHLALPQVQLISLDALENHYPDLPAVKDNRNPIEYVWTCKSSFVSYVMEQDPNAEAVIYLDADLYFYSDLQPLFNEIDQGSIVIVDHRFGPGLAGRAKRGIYNVGFLAFGRDAAGRQSLRWWREKCIDWCYARVEPQRYAEQKYLDDWPTRFDRVRVLEHKGAGLAPWNWMNYQISQQSDGQLWVDDQPLIFFHFANLRVINRWLYDTGLSAWQPMPARVRQWIYDPYLQAIKKAWQLAGRLDKTAIFMDRVARTRFGLRVFVESVFDGQIGWIA